MVIIKSTGVNIYAAQTLLSGTATHEYLAHLNEAWLILDCDGYTVKAEAVMRLPAKYADMALDAPVMDVANYVKGVTDMHMAIQQDVSARDAIYNAMGGVGELVKLINRPEWADVVCPDIGDTLSITSNDWSLGGPHTIEFDCATLEISVLDEHD